MHVDDSACNLASINLMKFRRADGSFDTADFEHTVDIVLLAQEIVVGPSSYPTEQIGANARRFRQLGLGYANLGAFLMSERDALRLRRRPRGRRRDHRADDRPRLPQVGRDRRRDRPLRRVREEPRAAQQRHADAPRRGLRDPDGQIADKGELVAAARRSWDEAVALGDEHGYRNAQATVLAPTGTISFLMDCDTTGIEPDFSLVKYKELVGGGSMTIVNRSVPLALQTLGYSDEASSRSPPSSTTRARSSAPPASRTPTCRCSTSRSASGRSATWATSR